MVRVVSSGNSSSGAGGRARRASKAGGAGRGRRKSVRLAAGSARAKIGAKPASRRVLPVGRWSQHDAVDSPSPSKRGATAAARRRCRVSAGWRNSRTGRDGRRTSSAPASFTCARARPLAGGRKCADGRRERNHRGRDPWRSIISMAAAALHAGNWKSAVERRQAGASQRRGVDVRQEVGVHVDAPAGASLVAPRPLVIGLRGRGRAVSTIGVICVDRRRVVNGARSGARWTTI